MGWWYHSTKSNSDILNQQLQQPQDFNVEAGYDFVIVNNVAFSGSSTPHGKAGMTSPEQDRDEWWTSMSRERSMGKTTPDQQLNKYRESSSPMKTHHDINGDFYGNRPNERSRWLIKTLVPLSSRCRSQQHHSMVRRLQRENDRLQDLSPTLGTLRLRLMVRLVR